MRGSIFDTPGRRLFLPTWRTQKGAIAAPHQSDAVLDQADGQAAKIMVLPGAAANALLAEQALCDFAITMSRQPGIEGSHHQNEAPTTLKRERKRRCTRTAAFDGAPKSVRRLQTDVGIGVEWQFD